MASSLRRKQAPAAATARASARRGPAGLWNSLPVLPRHLLAALAALALVAVLTSVTDGLTALRVANVGYYLLAVAGLQLLVGFSGQISLGNGAFMFIGAYTTALMVLYTPMAPLAVVMLAAVAAGCLAGMLVGAATARLHGPYLAGATLALAVGLPAVALRFPDLLGGSNGLFFSLRGAPPALSGLVSDSQWKALVVWFVVLLALVVLATTSRGRLGRRMRAIRDDEAAAATAGIPVGRTKVVAFVISAGCGSLAGACQAYLLGTATPSSFTLALSLSLLAALVLGGLGSLWGALWGALALVYLELAGEELAHAMGLGSNVANNAPVVFFGVILIVIVMAWPLGVQGALSRLGRSLRGR
ncbi:branched-chain amino acid ABC transporter permease [Actinorugispora endophytica]|uniref:Amino acid/amide ABC transporter membrane protein 2 (HAAT family) n=1 Tax=Actinorugispora endophytica TaxID=1605990 RepID=A0A4R6UHB5_9ACTN|nr:branched-chain amino acid ABC transporter permease [Actinorugispora endophytica]TDQ45742.1 amino acid/amide ABC transporter membrane protein 2 (HAAT family) [Actinorugispora endophytica]